MTLLWQLPPLFRFTAPFLGTLGIVLVGVVTGTYTQVPGARALESTLEQGDPDFDETGARLPQRRMWILTALCALVSLAIAIGLQLTVGDVLRYVVIDSMLYAWLGVCILVGLALLTVAYVRGRSPRRRARIRQILWAWPVGAGIPVANLFLGQVLEISPFSLIWNAFLLLVPISTADAIVRHDLLRLNATARRLVGGLTVAAVVGIGLGIVMYFAVTFLKVNEPSAMVALAAVLFAVAAPLSHRVQSNVESLLRQRRYDAGRLLADFTARASTATQLGDLLEKLKQVLEQSIQPSGFQLYRLDRAANQLVPQGAFTAPVLVDSIIAPWLERADPWIVDDEAPAPASLGGAALAVRLAVANEPVGLLVVAHRAGKTPYEAADVGFVLSLAGPLAAALVNALAFDAVARLNRELEDRVQARTKELEQKNAELALMNTRKDELVATVSHDFRSPLATIKQNVQTILKDLPRMDKEDVRMFVEAISRQETRLTALCINLLDLARLRQRSAPQDPVRLDEVARRLVEEMLPRADAAGIALTLDVAPGAPVVVRGDATRLAQVLQNLVDNALKFTAKDGRVTISFTREGSGDPAAQPPGPGLTDAEAHPQRRAKTEKLEGPRLRIDITDDGVGVPAEALPRLFEPFFQVPSQSHAGEGSGLGLAIVKAVVEAHRGDIRVSSEVGKGTTFSLVFPAEVASGQHAPREAAE
jgi:signal transduction histidine kinase